MEGPYFLDLIGGGQNSLLTDELSSRLIKVVGNAGQGAELRQQVGCLGAFARACDLSSANFVFDSQEWLVHVIDLEVVFLKVVARKIVASSTGCVHEGRIKLNLKDPIESGPSVIGHHNILLEQFFDLLAFFGLLEVGASIDPLDLVEDGVFANDFAGGVNPQKDTFLALEEVGAESLEHFETVDHLYFFGILGEVFASAANFSITESVHHRMKAVIEEQLQGLVVSAHFKRPPVIDGNTMTRDLEDELLVSRAHGALGEEVEATEDGVGELVG